MTDDPNLEQITFPGMEDAEMNPLTEAQLHSARVRQMFEVQHAADDWMDDYWALISQGYPWRIAVWLLWESQPRKERRPSTQTELATEWLGLTSDRMIREWKQNPAFEAKITILQRSILLKYRPDAFDALGKSASDPNYRAKPDRQLLFEMLGEYIPKQKMEFGAITPERAKEMPEEELRKRAALLRDRIVESDDDAD